MTSVYFFPSALCPEPGIFPGFLPQFVILRVVLDPVVPKNLHFPPGAKYAAEHLPGLDCLVLVPQVIPAQGLAMLLVLLPQLRALREAWWWCESSLPSSHVFSGFLFLK